MRDTFSYALLTEIAKVLLILLILLSAEYARQDDGTPPGPRAITQAEMID